MADAALPREAAERMEQEFVECVGPAPGDGEGSLAPTELIEAPASEPQT